MEGSQGQPAPTQAAESTQTQGQPSQGQAGATNIAATSATKEAAKEALRKLKIDDQEIDEDEVIKVYRERKGHQRAANKELQEGKAAKKQAEAFIQMMKDKGSLFDAIKKLGHDPRKLAEEYLAAQLEDELLDPREKELKTTKQRLEEFERKEKARMDDEEKRHQSELKAKFAQQYEAEFMDALKATKIQPTKINVSKMAGYISRAAKIKMPMTAVEAATLVKQDLINENRHNFQEFPADQIIELLGEEGLKKIREYEVSRLKDPSTNLRTPAEQGEASPRKRDSTARMTNQQWREFNRK